MKTKKMMMSAIFLTFSLSTQVAMANSAQKLILHYESSDPTDSGPSGTIDLFQNGSGQIDSPSSGTVETFNASSFQGVFADTIDQWKTVIAKLDPSAKMISCDETLDKGASIYEYAVTSSGQKVDLVRIDSSGHCEKLDSPYVLVDNPTANTVDLFDVGVLMALPF